MYRLFLHFLIWSNQLEHDIGAHTGMNPAYLSQLRKIINDYERDLRLLEIRV